MTPEKSPEFIYTAEMICNNFGMKFTSKTPQVAGVCVVGEPSRAGVLTSSKKFCVFRRICLSSDNSRKFRFKASELLLISFISFSSFSNVACKKTRKSSLNQSINRPLDHKPPGQSSRAVAALPDFLPSPKLEFHPFWFPYPRNLWKIGRNRLFTLSEGKEWSG